MSQSTKDCPVPRTCKYDPSKFNGDTTSLASVKSFSLILNCTWKKQYNLYNGLKRSFHYNRVLIRMLWD